MRFPRPLRCAVRRYRRYGAFALQAARDGLGARGPFDRPRQRQRWLNEARFAFTAAARLVLIGRPELERERDAYGVAEAEAKAERRRKSRLRGSQVVHS